MAWSQLEPIVLYRILVVWFLYSDRLSQVFTPPTLVSQTWDIHTFLLHSKRNVYTTSWSSQLLIGFLCKTKATFMSLLCWGGVSFFAAAVTQSSTACHSCPITSETSLEGLLGFIGSVTSWENLGSWWFLPWIQLTVWLTLLMESPAPCSLEQFGNNTFCLNTSVSLWNSLQ